MVVGVRLVVPRLRRAPRKLGPQPTVPVIRLVDTPCAVVGVDHGRLTVSGDGDVVADELVEVDAFGFGDWVVELATWVGPLPRNE